MTTAVLHVDDDPAYLELSESALANLDDSIDLTTATSAAEATSLLGERRFDCVVSDYVAAPDGTAFVETVGEAHPETPLILLSGKAVDDLPDPAVRSYLTDAIQKVGSDVFSDLVGRIHDHTTHGRDGVERPVMGTRRSFLEGATVADTAIRLLDVGDDPTGHLVEHLAEFRDCDVTDLPSLYTTIDADLLDSLFEQRHRTNGPGVELRFRYADFDVLLSSDGTAFFRDLTGADAN